MPRLAPKAVCPNPLHKGSVVKAAGTAKRKRGAVRRYRCEPAIVGLAHYFSVGIRGGRRERGQQGAPECPDHPKSHVVRNGPYGRGVNVRQRYRCAHAGRCNATCRKACDRDHEGRGHGRTCARACSGRHNFAPALPREHVGPGDRCDACLELRGIHRGEMAAARRQRLSARATARVLAALGSGTSYGKAGQLAETLLPNDAGRKARRPPAGGPKPRTRTSARRPKGHSPASRLANRYWHIGADITEAYGPVVWADSERRLRARAEQMAHEGSERVWILDDKPIYSLDESGKRKKTDGWALHLLAEMDWTDRHLPGITRLRLMRAFPKSTSVAWRLVFDEVGYVPDVIVSDAAKPIVAAVDDHFRDAPRRPLFVPSIWHMKDALRNNTLEKAMRGPAGEAIEAHFEDLRRDRALATPEAWAQWWEDLRALCAGLVVPANFETSRENYFDRMAEAIPLLAAEHRIKVSSGGLESILRDVETKLEVRLHQFANIERTNMLLDLMVAHANGHFSDLSRIVRLIEEDELPHRGWTVPMRTIEDPQPRGDRYSSLRDEGAMISVAAARGLL